MGDLVLATTRERVNGLDALQDIDELLATDARGPLPPLPAPFAAGRASTRGASSHRVAAADTEITPADGYGGGGGGGSGSDDEGKYAPRAGAAARALARLFPTLIPAASLPVTRADVEGRGGRWGRRRGSAPAPRRARRARGALLLLALVAGALIAARALLTGGGGLPAAWGGAGEVGGGVADAAAVAPLDAVAPGR